MSIPDSIHSSAIVEYEGVKYHVDCAWDAIYQQACIVVTKVGTPHMASDVMTCRDLLAMRGEGKLQRSITERAHGLVRKLHDYCHELKTYHGV
jgi:hypothetical protein